MKEDPWLSLWVEPEQPKIRSNKQVNISIGTKDAMRSEEVRAKAVKGGKTWLGKTRGEFTDEHKAKLSQAHKGLVQSEEHKENVSKALKGKPKSEEHKKALSERAKKMTDEHRRKLSDAAKRRKFNK
jgi:hypothetical protein